MDNSLSGRCLCGKVTWNAAGPVLWAGHCHCESCRRATSSPVTSFFGVPRGGVVWSGARNTVATSNGKVERTHCASCGSQMSYQFEGWPDETHLYAATLDDLAKFEPEAHYHFAEKVAWLEVTDNLPKYAGSADSSEPIDG